jgi:hypothetical protein
MLVVESAYRTLGGKKTNPIASIANKFTAKISLFPTQATYLDIGIYPFSFKQTHLVILSTHFSIHE